jgi:uncharacterized protein (UPF0276 family)
MTPSCLPAGAGVGFKPQHFGDIFQGEQPIDFIEIHAENFMGAGGPPHAQLRMLRDRYALSVHGVGLSIGSAEPLDGEHLLRLKLLCDRYEPASFSEHLAWSSHGGVFLNDLLPLPYTRETLKRVVDHIDVVQATLRRQMLLENPSTYLAFAQSTIPEVEFLAEIAGAAAAACCSTSTMCLSRRAITAPTRRNIWRRFRSNTSRKSISAVTTSKATTPAPRC